MRNITLARVSEEMMNPLDTVDIRNYIISFGSKFAPNTIDIFYGVECGFSREFFQNDFEPLITNLVLSGKARLNFYPAALDKLTVEFCSKTPHLPPTEKRKMFMNLCHPHDYNILISKNNNKNLERVFFDVAKILGQNPDITETLMVRINNKALKEIPSFFSINESISNSD